MEILTVVESEKTIQDKLVGKKVVKYGSSKAVTAVNFLII